MPKRIVEAALFVADRPLRIEELSRVSGHNLTHVRKILEELAREYDGRALEVTETPEGWHMRVRQDILPRVAHLTSHSDLTEGCKRTLALILYKEPVKQSDIIKMQGNKAYGYIKKLQKKGLVKAVKKGHTMMLELTQEFESYFGERKESLRERLGRELESSGRKMEAVEEKGGSEGIGDVDVGPSGAKRGIEHIIESMMPPAAKAAARPAPKPDAAETKPVLKPEAGAVKLESKAKPDAAKLAAKSLRPKPATGKPPKPVIVHDAAAKAQGKGEGLQAEAKPEAAAESEDRQKTSQSKGKEKTIKQKDAKVLVWTRGK